jgi:ABC-type sugar transport system, permease component
MTKRKKVTSVIFHTACMLFAFTALYPILWMISSSLKESAKVFVDAYNIIPSSINLDNYVRGWKGFAGITFATFFKNTFFVVILSTLGVLLSCSFIAYGFARLKFKFKNFWFMTVILTLMLPGQIIMVPQYVIFHKLHWINTYLPLIVPSFFGGSFFIFLIMQFIRTIPYELDESAKIDGCTRFQIYYKIIVPLIKPALITAAIFEFYWSWDNFLSALVYLGKPKLYTVSVALRLFSDPSTQTDWGALFAMATLSLIPPITVFFIFQKYIVEGISTSGLKG